MLNLHQTQWGTAGTAGPLDVYRTRMAPGIDNRGTGSQEKSLKKGRCIQWLSSPAPGFTSSKPHHRNYIDHSMSVMTIRVRYVTFLTMRRSGSHRRCAAAAAKNTMFAQGFVD
jgi:hypothetical protein